MSNVRLPIFNESSLDAVVGLEDLVQIGGLARETGKTVRAIHLYEELELLKPAARSKGRYRLYGREAIVRIRWITKLQDLGFTLSDIKGIVKELASQRSAPSAMTRVRDVYRRKLDEARAQMARLHALECEILASLSYLDTCDSVCEANRPVPDCQCCDHPHKTELPDLVAGLRG